MTQRLTNLEITRVSLVDKGANAKRLAVFKRDEEASMTDLVEPEATPAGVIAWLRKTLGLPEPMAKGAAPTGDAAMRSHLSAKAPGGHGMGDVAVADMAMADMQKKHTAMHTAGADHSHTVAKTMTFKEIVAGHELTDALRDNWYTLEDALWSALYATDDNLQPLSTAAKQALVAQNLDEFKAYLLEQMASVVAKADAPPSPGARTRSAVATLVAKVGKKISGSRLERLQAAAEALTSVLDEVAEAVTDEAAASAEEVPVDKAELVAAFTEANEPIVKRLEALEAAKTVTKTDGAGEEEGDEITLEVIAEAVEKIADRLDRIEGAQGVRKSIAAQDGTAADGSDKVKKSGTFAGILG